MRNDNLRPAVLFGPVSLNVSLFQPASTANETLVLLVETEATPATKFRSDGGPRFGTKRGLNRRRK